MVAGADFTQALGPEQQNLLTQLTLEQLYAPQKKGGSTAIAPPELQAKPVASGIDIAKPEDIAFVWALQELVNSKQFGGKK